MKKSLPFILFLFLLTVSLYAQEVIELQNPSFEGKPGASRMPLSWYNYGKERFPYESPPDLHGEISLDSFSNIFEVNMKAFEGRTFLGLVVRDNNTWESVSQSLSSELLAGKTYIFTLHVARSENLWSRIAPRNDEGLQKSNYGRKISMINHNTPVVLKIWGTNFNFSKKTELLYESEAIENTDWKQLDIQLMPYYHHDNIILEAYYVEEGETYNGNLLIDNCSSIKEVIPTKGKE